MGEVGGLLAQRMEEQEGSEEEESVKPWPRPRSCQKNAAGAGSREGISEEGDAVNCGSVPPA